MKKGTWEIDVVYLNGDTEKFIKSDSTWFPLLKPHVTGSSKGAGMCVYTIGKGTPDIVACGVRTYTKKRLR
jgi:hypothetical protein